MAGAHFADLLFDLFDSPKLQVRLALRFLLPHPGAEQIVETYYSAAMLSWAHVSLDYQWVKNPAYNTDRGPVSILAVRVHAQL